MPPDEEGGQHEDPRPAPNAYDLRMIALEHAVQTRDADDDAKGESVVARADKFLSFLKGNN